MRFSKLLFGIVLLSVPFVLADDDESKDSSESDAPKGKAANTDTTEIAGKYEVVYYSNSTNSKDIIFLKCGQSKKFTITIPSGSDGKIEHDTKGLDGEADPIYKTILGDWTIKEYTKVKSLFNLKIELPIGDNESNNKIVCWLVSPNKETGNLRININPQKLQTCPTELVTSTDSCKTNLAHLEAKCVDGACKPGNSKSKSDSKDSDSGKGSSSALTLSTPTFFLASLAIYASL
ncbi:hypothetical protein K502DRAFT_340288 [Neoconidiobolus thromboides FSU 785]|nr:hypothetical protein K502DRAFT_340288 [Neoconidiobolus thromboides FSU 785]